MFYEHDDECILLKIVLKDMVGYYNDYKDNSKYDAKYIAKRMNFRLNHDSIDKDYDIFENIEEQLEIGLNIYMYESRGEEYLKTIASNDEIWFKKTRIIKLILIILSIIVEYYYKYNLFSIV